MSDNKPASYTGTLETAPHRNDSTWIEQVLLPELNTRYDNIYNQNNVFKGLEKLEQLMSIKQFILSHRDEWKGR